MSGTKAKAWVQGPGGWRRADSAPTVPLRPAQKQMSELTAAFNKQPLNFMRQHPVSPANGDVSKGVSTVEWALNPLDITMDEQRGVYEGATYHNVGGDKTAFGQRLNMGGAIKYMVLKSAGSIYKGNTLQGRAGEVLPILADTPQQHSEASIPIYWLPWSSLKITETTIPPVPSNLVDPPEDEYPRFFFTAGVNGCSVFARGDATSPTIFHGGLADKLTRNSKEFWRDQMRMAQTGFDVAKVKGEVHKGEYMLTDDREKRAAQDFVRWMETSEPGAFTVDLLVGFGCIFGVRFGRHWTLYLQENSVLQRTQFFKRKDLTKEEYEDGTKKYFEKGTTSPVMLTTTITPRKILPDKKVQVFTRKTNMVRPMQVVEFYPNRNWSGSFQDVVQAHRG